MNIIAIDLFCGIGGITHGFVRQGIKVIAGYDNDPSCKYAYETNNNARFICTDIASIVPKDIANLFPKDSIRIIIGCAPCQPYSTYSYKSKKDNDPRYKTLTYFSQIIEEVQPEIVSMENVPDLYKKNYPQYVEFIHILKKCNYSIFEKIINCADYGVPQSRKRLVIVASKLGKFDLIPPTHKNNYITVRDTIAHLPTIKHGTSDKKDFIHKCSKLSPINLKRIKATPEGGGWKDWPKHLLLACHKKETGKTYSSVYGRMSWDNIAPTITTQSYRLGTGRFGHPEQNRAISLREAALLQTFPNSYQFISPQEHINFFNTGKHIGNAVPVKLAEVIAISIKKHLQKYSYPLQNPFVL